MYVACGQVAVGSCNVVGGQVGLLVGGRAIVRVLACVTLGDGPSVGTLDLAW